MTSFDPKWEELHKQRAWGKYPNEHLIRFVMRNFNRPFSQYEALDIGCGGGAQTMFLGREGFHAHGIDGSQSAIDRCVDHAFIDEFTGQIGFQVGDAVALPFPDESMDLCVDVCCLQHLNQHDAERAIIEVMRVLKPNGKFFSITARWSDTTAADTPMRRMRRTDVEHLYARTGFPIVELDHEEYTQRRGTLIISHWLIGCVKIA